MLKRYILILSCLFFLSGCINGETAKINTEPYTKQGFLMGTYVSLSVYDDGLEDSLEVAYAKIEELADKVSSNDQESEVDQINQQAGISPVEVSKETYELISQAYDYSAEEDSGFELTIGVITSLWHIGFDDARKPAADEIDQALSLVNYQEVELNEDNHSVFLKKEGMKLDLGAIAKGYITDQVVEVLIEQGVTCAIVDLGGNVYVLGNSPRDDQTNPWTVGLQDPNKSRNNTFGTISASNKSVVTSGIYERYLMVDGVNYHHIFNPDTGYPYDNDIAGVTIISETSIMGDALTTAVFSMGVEAGLAYANDHPEISAIFITTDGKVYLSDNIKEGFILDTSSGYTLADD